MSMNRIERLTYRCYKILPLVYDESLSYYEVICKCTEKLNEVINSMDEMVTDFNQWDERFDEIEASFDSIETTLALHTTQIAGMQGDITGMQGDITGLGQEIETIENAITSLSNRLLPVESGLAALRISTAQDIADVNGRCTQAEVRIGQLENDKLNKNDPAGTGALSMNRKANTQVGDNSATLGTNGTAGYTVFSARLR